MKAPLAAVSSTPVLFAAWLLAVCSGLVVVWNSQDSRALLNELQELKTEAYEMRVAHGQYLLQHRSLVSPLHLESRASSELSLRAPSSKEIRVLAVGSNRLVQANSSVAIKPLGVGQ